MAGGRRMRFLRLYSCWIIAIILMVPSQGLAASISTKAPSTSPAKSEWDERMELFIEYEALYGIPWKYVAAIDQYERTIKKKSKNKEAESANKRLTAIKVPTELWCGVFNPDSEDNNLTSITFFHGIGLDGSGDGIADQDNDRDVLTSLVRFLGTYGFNSDDFKIGLWNYYKRDSAVRTIMHFSRIYEKFQTLALNEHAFPIPKRFSYSYRSTWGDPRGWGGRRIHEGVDIFAGYSTPVMSTGYGVVEVLGWNRYGGWRVGIRDIDNIYHYFAHLSSFKKGLKEGDIVVPGEVIGYVGSSGYGKPGTSGKFPPHLHYGTYRDTGNNEWAFDPYPLLKRWENQKKQPKPIYK